MTDKLYYNDPYTLEFFAEIKEVKTFEQNKYSVILDKTYFYPTSGGQPFDTGTINNIKVIDVFEKEGEIYHIVESPVEIGKMHGKIDYHRRLEHMQHHTGQHLLSQAFIQVLKAPTVSFHLGTEISTIEIIIKDLTIEQVNDVEELANDIIYQNRNINILYVNESEINELSLRKKPKKKCASGDIRVIEIEDFDLSPCGGTHAKMTGELGLIKIIGWEKYKGNLRVDFLCGRRAIIDYRFKNRVIKNIANKFSTKDKQIEDIIYKSIDETKTIQRELTSVKKEITKYITKELLENADNYNELRLVTKEIENTDINSLKQLGLELINEKKILIFLASKYNKNLILSLPVQKI